jgi:heme-degrading monooxygenase HmoA
MTPAVRLLLPVSMQAKGEHRASVSIANRTQQSLASAQLQWHYLCGKMYISFSIRSSYMHALLIEGSLKPGKKNEFMKIWESRILTGLKQQKGFVDEILLMMEEGQDGVGVSLWQTKADADRYYNEVFPKQVAQVSDLMAGTPTMRPFNVEHADTFKITASKAA